MARATIQSAAHRRKYFDSVCIWLVHVWFISDSPSPANAETKCTAEATMQAVDSASVEGLRGRFDVSFVTQQVCQYVLEQPIIPPLSTADRIACTVDSRRNECGTYAMAEQVK